MMKKERALKAVEILKELYPDAICSLTASNPFELLVAVRLSAQCTDARVNIVTPALFDRYKTIEDYAGADVKDIEKYIHSCGFYKSKAESIVGMAQRILSDIYGKPAIVVDTHCIRITNRIGLVAEKDPKKIEFALKKIIPAEEGSDFCHRLVLFGRDICSARKPLCDECKMREICKIAYEQ